MSVWVRKSTLLKREKPFQAFCCLLDKGDVFHVEETIELLQYHGDQSPNKCIIVDDSTILQQYLSLTGNSKDFLVIIVKSEAIDKSTAYRFNNGIITQLKIEFTQGLDHLFSRNQGLVVTSKLRLKTVAIIGMGNIVVPACLELAKAGVGRFVLIGHDRVNSFDLFNHPWDARDYGRLKTNALKDILHARNPIAEVFTLNDDINSTTNNLQDLLEGFGCSLILAASPETKSQISNLNTLVQALKKTLITGRLFSSGAYGDILKVPSNGTGSCLNCAYGDICSESLHPENVPVGFSLDCNPFSQMMAKLALLELCLMDLTEAEQIETGASELKMDMNANMYAYFNRSDSLIDPSLVPFTKTINFTKVNSDYSGTWYEVMKPVLDTLLNSISARSMFFDVNGTFDRKRSLYVISFSTVQGNWVINIPETFSHDNTVFLHPKLRENQAKFPIRFPEKHDISWNGAIDLIQNALSTEQVNQYSTNLLKPRICSWYILKTERKCDFCCC